LFTTKPFQRSMSGQPDVQPVLHVPTVYESVPVELPRWEYQTITVDAREEGLLAAERLNELGQEGWLLIGVLDQGAAGRSSQVHYYFVRQRLA